MKSGGEGKADTDGTVDSDDLVCETARGHLSSGFEHELEKPTTGGWYGGEGSAASFVEDSACPHKVSCGDCCSGTSRG